MVEDTEWLLEAFKNPDAKFLLLKILNDEKKHVAIAKELIGLL